MANLIAFQKIPKIKKLEKIINKCFSRFVWWLNRQLNRIQMRSFNVFCSTQWWTGDTGGGKFELIFKKKWFDSFFQGKTIEFVSYLHEFCSDSEENDLICWGRGSAVGGGGGGWRDLGDRLFHLKKWSWHHHHRVDWNWKTHKMALVIRMFHCYITFTSMQISSGFCLIIFFQKNY